MKERSKKLSQELGCVSTMGDLLTEMKKLAPANDQQEIEEELELIESLRNS